MSANENFIDAEKKQFLATTSSYSTRRKIRSKDLSIASSPLQITSKRKRRNSTSAVHCRTPDSHTNHGYFGMRDTHGYQEHIYIMRDGTHISPDDCVYLVCEPPSEPYYLGRVMDFTKMNAASASLDAVRINWFYRPRDIQRQNYDSRLLFATMHSDISPLTSIRGKCTVLHKSQIETIDTFREQPDSFYYDRLFDKFMRRQYEVIPVDAVTNVPERVREVLQLRWKYVVVESNRSKELAMEHRACKCCNDWCSSKDSVRCAICKSDFHMQCVQPPLPRKPSRGFVWTCTSCSRAEAMQAQEDQGHVSETQSIMGEATEPIEDVPVEGIEQSGKKLQVRSSLPLGKDAVHPPLESSCGPSTSNPERWPYRYLGIHCNVNDAVDHDDRIYPRAASRIGQKYQAAVQEWPGRPIQYFERSRRPIKRTVKAMKGKRSDQRASIDSAPLEYMRNHPREEPSAVGQYFTGSNEECEENTKSLNPTSMTAAERPLWLQEKPTNYLARGEGQTAECIWSPSDELSESEYTEYLQLAKPIANDLGIKWYTPNFLDAALRALYINDHSLVNAIASLKQIDRLSLKEPSFSPSELARFENSVRKHGSELAQVARDVTTRSVADCVRLYYTWKKTSKGGRIWALSEARKPKIDQTGTKTTSQSEDLGESSDDSAYDQAKANKLKMSFQCKFCSGATSKRWRRAPGSVVSDKSISALCDRCADLWRKYAVSWEPPEDVFKKLNESAYRNRKKRVEAELVKELPINGLRPEKLQEDSLDTMKHNKKAKRTEKSKLSERSTPVDDCLPCSICESKEDTGLLTCCDCSLVVHRACYGTFVDDEIRSSWKCDPCENSSSPHASTDYGCVLCPFRESDDSKCVGPVRRTAGNNWAHVLCATWNPKLKLEMSSNSFTIQGITAIPLQQWQSICAVCDTNAGACVNCTTCDMAVHVMCAHTAGYVMAFDVQPIKSSQSRRDSLTLVRLGSETGLMTPVLHCRDHDLKRVTIHPPSRSSADIGVSALALYNRTYKTSLRNRFRRGPSNSHYHNRQDNLENIQLKIHELRSPKFAREDNRATAGSTSFDQCARCKTDFSPCFYSEAIPDLSTRSTNGVDEACMTSKLCHRCYWIEHMQTGNFTPMPVLDTQIKEY